MAETFASYSGVRSTFIYCLNGIWTKPSDCQIERYSATSWDSYAIACSSPYILTLLPQIVSMDGLTRVGVQARSCLKKGEVLGRKTAAYNADLALTSKQLL